MKFAAPSLFFFSLALAAKLVTPATVAQVIADTKSLSTLDNLLELAGLKPALNDAEGPFTVFAPNKGAFNSFNAATLTRLKDPSWLYHLRDLLEYHVTSPAVESADLTKDQNFTMLNLETTKVTAVNPATINGYAKINTADKTADNGVVHVINSLLLPASLETNMIEALSEYKEVSNLIVTAGLVDALIGPGPFTLFVPSNEAVLALGQETLDYLGSNEGASELDNILQYHLVQGNYYAADFADGQTITMSNGDALTISLEGVMMEGNSTMAMMDKNTTDADAEDTATAVAKAMAEDDSSKAVVADDDMEYMVKINEEIMVTEADILVTNGVIHVIDTVLMPPVAADEGDMV